MADSKRVSKTILYKTNEGEFKLVLPVGARFTFGPALPFERKNPNPYSSRTEYAIRIYENSKNESLVAVITGVYEVRDISLPLAKLITRESGKSVWKSDETGYEVSTKVNKDQSWQDVSALKQLNEVNE